MDLYHVMRTTGAVRRFTDDPLPDDVLGRILDNARFAPSGGNRQGVRVIALRAPMADDLREQGKVGGKVEIAFHYRNDAILFRQLFKSSLQDHLDGKRKDT